MHPAVALAEHLDEKLFQLLPVVVAPEEKVLDGVAEFGMFGIAELLEGGARSTAVEFSRSFVDLQIVADAGVDGLLDGEVAAEGVDGGDAEL